jgi:hypothetical protein
MRVQQVAADVVRLEDDGRAGDPLGQPDMHEVVDDRDGGPRPRPGRGVGVQQERAFQDAIEPFDRRGVEKRGQGPFLLQRDGARIPDRQAAGVAERAAQAFAHQAAVAGEFVPGLLGIMVDEQPEHVIAAAEQMAHLGGVQPVASARAPEGAHMQGDRAEPGAAYRGGLDVRAAVRAAISVVRDGRPDAGALLDIARRRRVGRMEDDPPEGRARAEAHRHRGGVGEAGLAGCRVAGGEMDVQFAVDRAIEPEFRRQGENVFEIDEIGLAQHPGRARPAEAKSVDQGRGLERAESRQVAHALLGDAATPSRARLVAQLGLLNDDRSYRTFGFASPLLGAPGKLEIGPIPSAHRFAEFRENSKSALSGG